MLAQLNTFALLGIDAVPVQVEVDTSPSQQPRTVIVGLPEMAVRESIHRIERALVNLGYRLPTGRTVVNLAPADLRKDAGAFDLPIALGLIASMGQIAADKIETFAIVGELALDGIVRPVVGALSMAMEARTRGIDKLIVPVANAREASVVREVEVYGVGSLAEAVGIVTGLAPIDPVSPPTDDIEAKLNKYTIDFADVKGQEFAKRALTVAASGAHNVVMLGSPGSGKTMLARRLPTILPPLTPNESLETTRVYSAVGKLQPGESLLCTRPFRSPHHTISDAGMVGGGSVPQPGEISLAHHGVLFLDELPEFNRRSLEALRQPLEEGRVTISRAAHSTTFPADFVLCAAMNPCPCGFLGDPKKPCKCAPIAVEKYMGRISGPLLDRIDLHIEVPPVPFEDLSKPGDGTGSAAMREQVFAARAIQAQRFGTQAGGLNGRMTSKQIRTFCVLDADGQTTLKEAMEALGLSARAHDRILRVARTIADLAASERITQDHVAEAIGFRALDRKLWER
ncbi:YifB family Mg chelatase-like AAA ATPase [Gemmata sp. G18]|uniref:YifB family Mg chelatase-like AAA ATPase n=1 Tax=Gemmata palustris TaxID=2822762 RepID=A0ABS5C4A5_9BACT|nr:YifB family Mg chelatase-like AAA ATPase [Gemmata palustris]MBP3959983.1 YifB family Mg chelatase-like AAA ATPase [Gemmata palustris]